MSKKASPTLIGIFTLVSLLLAGGALVLFGAGKVFEKRSTLLLYFDKSVNGLLTGSEVRLGGVPIGRVTSIKVLIDPLNQRKIIPVEVQLSHKALAGVGSTSGGGIDFVTETGVAQAVADGLRARMKQQSLLTGQLYIEFDIVPNSPFFSYEPAVKPPYPTVPTIGTEIDELISGVADGLKKFNALDLAVVTKDLSELITTTKSQIAALQMKEINDNLVGMTTQLRILTRDEKLKQAAGHLDEALVSFRDLAQRANQGIDPVLKDLEKVLLQASASLGKIGKASADISEVANPRAPVLMRLQNVLEEFERASRAIKELASDLKRNPNSLLLGKDPKP